MGREELGVLEGAPDAGERDIVYGYADPGKERVGQRPLIRQATCAIASLK